MLLVDELNIREVLTFPMNQQAVDLHDGCTGIELLMEKAARALHRAARPSSPKKTRTSMFFPCQARGQRRAHPSLNFPRSGGGP